MNARPWLPGWLPELLAPALYAGMMGSLAWSIASLARTFFPDWNAWLTVIVAVLTVFEASFTFHLFKRRFVFLTDRWQMRVIEVVVLFVAVKLAGLLSQPLPPLADLLRVWSDDLLAILDLQTVVNFLVALAALIATTETLDDLDRLSDPERSMATTVPRDRLYGRFFTGGFLLIVTSGVALIGLEMLLDLSRPTMTGWVLNALVYFLCGLALLGVANYMYWGAIWDYERVEVNASLGRRWAWHALALVGLAAGAAFLLPTGYSDGLFSLGRWLVVIFGFLAYLIYLLIYYVFALIAALLNLILPDIPVEETAGPAPRPTLAPPPEFVVEPPVVVADPFWEQLRLILFGVILVAMAGVVLFLYLRDRPEFLKLLRDARWLRGLIRFWEALRLRGANWAQALGRSLAGGLARLRGSVPAQLRFWSLRRATPRDQVRYYYLSMLRRAGEQGVRRKPSQTPDEYDPVLGTHMAEAQPDVHALTEAFDRARYSGAPVDAEQARAARTVWERLRAALQRNKQPPPTGAA
ncbi:MAG TPA: DUF4129 domain-containing protein [Anaerolineales bacterium]|nr:DUF4129 domain-containing protein [Anaerolineales bacterium]